MARTSRRAWRDRIVAYLLKAESKEPDAHIRDDIHIARMTVAKAALGEKHPFRDACLEYLGLLPEKVWPKIVERRKAQLGNCYSLFYDENDLRRSFDWEQFLEQPLPPKKPSESVHSTFVEKSREVIGAKSWLKTSAAQTQQSAPPLKVVRPLDMASTAAAYRKSDASSSAKTRVLSREDVARLLAFADFSTERTAAHPRHSTRLYYRDHLRATLIGMWEAAGEVHGNEILLFASIGKYSHASRKCERQIRYNLRVLETDGVLEKVFPANSRIRPGYFRHTTTYRLRIDRLRQRQTCRQYEESKPITAPIAPKRVEHMPAPQSMQAPPQPANEQRPRVHGTHTRRDCAKFLGTLVELMRGSSPYQANRKAMNRDDALHEACRIWAWTEASVIEAMKFHGFKLPEGEQ